MSLVSRLFARFCKLPPAITRDIATEPLRIPMRDGTELLADRYYARPAAPAPTVLIRSCYGRSAFKVLATVFAERGMQVVCQSCRGTAGSQGVFRPFFDEEDDGADTVEWIERQPWFSGKLALWGISYLGNTAWAVAKSKVGARVNALGLHVTLTNFRDRTYAFDGFTLITCVDWTLTMLNIVRTGGRRSLSALIEQRKAKAAGSASGRHNSTAKSRPVDDAGRCFLVAGLDGSRRARRPMVGAGQLRFRRPNHAAQCDGRGLV